MSNGTKKTGLKNWYHGLQAEFRKITWPDRETLTRETVTVTVAAIVLGVIIATLDMILQYGINFLI
jgi:preprotein translocase subunit SecE